jgi:hypothetical protein
MGSPHLAVPYAADFGDTGAIRWAVFLTQEGVRDKELIRS